MQRLIAFGILLFAFSSVQMKSPPEPLTPQEMVDVLTDLELTKAMVDYYIKDEAAASQLLKENANLVYESYGITPETFQRSYQYHLKQLGAMKRIYDRVVERLEGQN